MKLFSALHSRLTKIKDQHGFTMIELLIVISILGILAVAVLSAINPVEQINRGRDTGSRSDAEQLLSAIDRYNAFKSYFPWQTSVNDSIGLPLTDDGSTSGIPIVLSTTGPTDGTCHILNKLSNGISVGLAGVQCANDGTNELKASFANRVVSSNSARELVLYNRGTSGDSTYVCFYPMSDAFQNEARDRCDGDTSDGNGDYLAGAGLPTDLQNVADYICGTTVVPNVASALAGDAMVCLP